MANALESASFYPTVNTLKARAGPGLEKFAIVLANLKLYRWYPGNADADDSDTDADTIAPSGGGYTGRWKSIAFIATAQADDVGALTAASGTPSSNLADVGASFSQTTLNNNFASLAEQINELREALRTAGVMA
jgi:hypothetical protein